MLVPVAWESLSYFQRLISKPSIFTQSSDQRHRVLETSRNVWKVCTEDHMLKRPWHSFEIGRRLPPNHLSSFHGFPSHHLPTCPSHCDSNFFDRIPDSILLPVHHFQPLASDFPDSYRSLSAPNPTLCCHPRIRHCVDSCWVIWFSIRDHHVDHTL